MSVPSPQPSSKPSPHRGGLFRLILLYTRGLIVDQHQRRVTMFYTILVAMFMVLFGWEFLRDWLEPHAHFYRFAIFWMLCGWLTILAALLAVYDLLVVNHQARVAQRALRAKMLGREYMEREKDE